MLGEIKAELAVYMNKLKNLLLQKGDGWTLTVPQDKASKVIRELAQ